MSNNIDPVYQLIRTNQEKKFGGSVESINNINNINYSNNINNRNNMATFNQSELELNAANRTSSSRPIGEVTSFPNTSPKGLEAARDGKGVVAAGPGDLAQIREQLKAQDQWIYQNSIAYLQVHIWFTDVQDLTSLKCQYAFTTFRAGRTDLRQNRFSAKFTRNRFDHIRNIRASWNDSEIEMPYHTKIHDFIKLGTEQGFYAGGAKATITKSPRRQPGVNPSSPIQPFVGLLLENHDADWHLHLWHHDFYVQLDYPQELWNEDSSKWLDKYQIILEQPAAKRPKNVEPAIKFAPWSQQ